MRPNVFAAAIAAAVASFASPVAAQDDPRAAAVSAALPGAPEGYQPVDDVVDVSGTPPALTVVRMFVGGPGVPMVNARVWTKDATVEEAAIMLDAATITPMGGEIVEIAGQKGSIVNGVINLYPGYPDKALTVTVGGSTDVAFLKTLAEGVNYEALLAIE